MENSPQLKSMERQLVQVFEYAELLTRLSKAQELLDVEGGYVGEDDLYNEIENVKILVRKEIEKK